MTATEFEAVRPLLKISAERTEAARAALVDGDTLQAVGERYGWSRQAVGDAVNAVWRVQENCLESQRVMANAGTLLPPGWERVTLIAPTHMVAKFRREIAEASQSPVNKTRAKKNS